MLRRLPLATCLFFQLLQNGDEWQRRGRCTHMRTEVSVSCIVSGFCFVRILGSLYREALPATLVVFICYENVENHWGYSGWGSTALSQQAVHAKTRWTEALVMLFSCRVGSFIRKRYDCHEPRPYMKYEVGHGSHISSCRVTTNLVVEPIIGVAADFVSYCQVHLWKHHLRQYTGYGEGETSNRWHF